MNRIQDGAQDKQAELEFSQGQPKHEILFSFQRKASLTNRKIEIPVGPALNVLGIRFGSFAHEQNCGSRVQILEGIKRDASRVRQVPYE